VHLLLLPCGIWMYSNARRGITHLGDAHVADPRQLGPFSHYSPPAPPPLGFA
jgi:hypothetical protein